jgi:hypothetical protein
MLYTEEWYLLGRDAMWLFWERRHIPEDGIPHSHSHENFKSYVLHIASKLVSRFLGNEQQGCINICLELWENANEDPTFISRIIMGVKKVGFMVLIQKQSNNHCSGRAHNHQEQERPGRSAVQQRECSVFLLVYRGEFIVNLLLLTPWSTLLLWCFETPERKCVEKGWNSDIAATGFVTTTHHPHVPENQRLCD